MSWDKAIVRRTIELAADNPDAQLQFLLQRLEFCPEALEFIALATEDMAAWQEAQAAEIDGYVRRRNGGAEIIELNPPK